jgi:V/A-type H+-transporting ATPase subunit E
MTLENVIDEILAQARRESKKIVEDGKREAEAIIENAKKTAKEKRENFRKETEKLIEGEAKDTQISTKNLKIDRMVMQAKNDFLNELFLEFTKRIDKLSLKERRKIIEKLVKKAVKEIDDPAFVYANNKDKQFVLHLKNIKFNGTIDTIGGVIVENRKRDIRVNYTFEVFLGELKEMYLCEIANRFF